MTIGLFDTRKQVSAAFVDQHTDFTHHLVTQLTFYGAYHSNPTNILIHVFGVPLLLWCVVQLALLAFIGVLTFK